MLAHVVLDLLLVHCFLSACLWFCFVLRAQSLVSHLHIFHEGGKQLANKFDKLLSADLSIVIRINSIDKLLNIFFAHIFVDACLLLQHLYSFFYLPWFYEPIPINVHTVKYSVNLMYYLGWNLMLWYIFMNWGRFFRFSLYFLRWSIYFVLYCLSRLSFRIYLVWQLWLLCWFYRLTRVIYSCSNVRSLLCYLFCILWIVS